MLSRKSPSVLTITVSFLYTTSPDLPFCNYKKVGCQKTNWFAPGHRVISQDLHARRADRAHTGSQPHLDGHKNHIFSVSATIFEHDLSPPNHIIIELSLLFQRRLFEECRGSNKLFLHPNRFAQPSPSNRWEEVEGTRTRTFKHSQLKAESSQHRRKFPTPGIWLIPLGT